MNPTNIKLGLSVALFGAWAALVVCHVSGAEDLITNIKLALMGLGVYHLKTPKDGGDA